MSLNLSGRLYIYMFVCKARNSSTDFMREQRVRTEYSKDAVGNSQVEGFSRVMTPQIAFLPNLFFSSFQPTHLPVCGANIRKRLSDPVNDKHYDNHLFVDVAGNDDYGVVAHTGNQGAATAASAL